MTMTARALSRAEEERKTPAASLFFALPYMGLMALSVLYPYFMVARLPWFTMHVCYILIIGLAGLWVFVTGKYARVMRALEAALLYGGLYMVLMMHSLALWITQLDSMSMIRRGGTVLAYQLLGIAAVSAAYVLFGRKAILYTFLGMAAGNALLLLGAMVSIGPGDFIGQIIAFYLSLGGEDNAASRAMEVHDLTFAFGEMVIYFWLFGKGQKGRWLCLAASAAFFLLGWKRIAIPGIALAGLYVWYTRRGDARRARRRTGVIALCLIAAGYLYIVFIRAGLYAQICNALGIDTMGRIELLRFIESYYTLSPLYMGQGIGFITRMMQDFIESGKAVLNAAMSIHNDILARYIELGCLGFFVWALYLFFGTARWMFTHWSRRAGALFFSMLLFCFITYLTDNTASYYHINFCLRLFPLAVAAGAEKGEDAPAAKELSA